MNNEDKLTYKVLVLYAFDRLGKSAAKFEISDVFTKLGLMNIFELTEVIEEVVDNELVKAPENGSIYYTLTKLGLESLDALKDNMNTTHKRQIDIETSLINQNKNKSLYVNAMYHKKPNDNTDIELFYRKDDKLIKINLNADSNTEAELICRNWNNFSEEIKTKLLNMLTLKFEED